MNSKDMAKAVNQLFDKNRYVLFNSYIFDWESDYFSLTTPAEYAIEVEIKISVADFKKDFTKTDKHSVLSNCSKKYISLPTYQNSIQSNGGHYDYDENGKHTWVKHEPYCQTNIIEPKLLSPNKFYYAAPKDLLRLHTIPHYAGLIEITGDPLRTEAGHRPTAYIKKPAPFLHKEPIFPKYHRKILDKFWWETHNMRLDYEYQKFLVQELKKNLNHQEKINP